MKLTDKTVLIIDDDEDMLKLLQRILSSAGLRVLMADSPSVGRALLEQEAPHVVITDLHMTPEDGFSLIQSIRSNRSYRHTPILVLSALNDFQSVKKAIALGISDYVIKPLQAPLLLRKLKKALFNKDFVKWEALDGEELEVSVPLKVKIISMGETGLQLQGPFKLAPGKTVRLQFSQLEELCLDEVVLKASSLPKTYRPGGLFINDITFVGVTEAVASKVRQFKQKRKS